MITYLETAYGNQRECICADELSDVLQNIVRLIQPVEVTQLQLIAGTDNVKIVAINNGYEISVSNPQPEVIEFVQQQADWNNNNPNSPQYILGKPHLPSQLIQSVAADYNQDGQSIAFSRGNHSTGSGTFQKVAYFTLGVADGTRAGLLSSDMYNSIQDLIINGSTYVHPRFLPKSLELYKIGVNGEGHVNAATPISKQELQLKVGIANQNEPGLLTSTDYNKIFPIQETVNSSSNNPVSSKGVYQALQTAFQNYEGGSRGVKFHNLVDITTPSADYILGDIGRVCSTQLVQDTQLLPVNQFDSYQNIKMSEVVDEVKNSDEGTVVKLAGWNIKLRSGQYNPEFKLFLYYIKFSGIGYYFFIVAPLSVTPSQVKDMFQSSYYYITGNTSTIPSNTNRIVGDLFTTSIMDLFSNSRCDDTLYPYYTPIDTDQSVNTTIKTVEPWSEGNWGTELLNGYPEEYKGYLRTDIGVQDGKLQYVSEVVYSTDCTYYIYTGLRWEKICVENCCGETSGETPQPGYDNEQLNSLAAEVNALIERMDVVESFQSSIDANTNDVGSLKSKLNSVIDYVAQVPVDAMKSVAGQEDLSATWKAATQTGEPEDIQNWTYEPLVNLKYN